MVNRTTQGVLQSASPCLCIFAKEIPINRAFLKTCCFALTNRAAFRQIRKTSRRADLLLFAGTIFILILFNPLQPDQFLTILHIDKAYALGIPTQH